MKNRTAYPADTATGACLITRSSRVKPGETIIDLQMDVESLPSYGRLCIHEHGVRLLNVQLGWQVRDPDEDEQIEQMRATMEELRSELTAARDALRAVFAAAETVGVELPGEAHALDLERSELPDSDEVMIG